jgi:AbrB family looped-hinge helix DNA binding protein
MRHLQLSRPDHQQRLIAAEVDLRDKNQITLPKRVADVLGVHPGDRLIFVVDECDPTVVHMHRLPDSYAGALAGVYGTPEEAKAYLQAEREAWS